MEQVYMSRFGLLVLVTITDNYVLVEVNGEAFSLKPFLWKRLFKKQLTYLSEL